MRTIRIYIFRGEKECKRPPHLHRGSLLFTVTHPHTFGSPAGGVRPDRYGHHYRLTRGTRPRPLYPDPPAAGAGARLRLARGRSCGRGIRAAGNPSL